MDSCIACIRCVNHLIRILRHTHCICGAATGGLTTTLHGPSVVFSGWRGELKGDGVGLCPLPLIITITIIIIFLF